MNTLAMVSLSGGLSSLFTDVSPEQRFVVAIVAIGCTLAGILGLAGIITGMVSAIHRRRAEIDFKREMIERGMSAEDIATVIAAGGPPEDATERFWAAFGKPKKP